MTVFKNNQGKDVCVLYRQMDGYPTGHGAELALFLNRFNMVQGFTPEDKERVSANGIECLAAQAVAHFKTEIGQFYLYPSGTRDIGEEYTYVVTLKGDKIHLDAYEGAVAFFGMPGKVPAKDMPKIFDGLPGQFDAEAIEAKFH